MVKIKSETARRALLTAAVVLMTAFIFIHSMMSGDDSAAESGGILMMLNSVGERLGLPRILSDLLIRKAAHLTEFAVWGALFTAAAEQWRDKLPGLLRRLPFYLLLVPVTDETIQLFPVGRSSEVGDVWIDFAGAVIGALAASAVLAKYRKKGS